VTIVNERAGLWLRCVFVAGLYAVALLMLALTLPAVGAETTPTRDPDTAASPFFCLVASAVFLAAAAAVSRRWRSVRVLCVVPLGLMVVVWTQVPSPF
jgi:hypothetical protein